MKIFYATLWHWAQRGILPEDNDSERVKKTVLTLVAGIIAFLGIFWGALYVFLGYPRSGSIPLSYSVISFTSIAYFFATKQFAFFRFSQLLLILLLPFLLQWSLGGFANGSAVMVWAFFAPLAAMLFADLTHAAGWLLAFLVLTFISGLFDSTLAAHAQPMPAVPNAIFFVMNLGIGFGAVYFVLNSFVKDREKSHHEVVMAKDALERVNIELEKNQEKLRELMLTDPLTGTANRRHLDARLGIELDRMRRYNTPLTVVMADLDNFKAINDIHGHEVGDKVLKATATVIRANLRNTDFVARFGGEEFVILLPETGIEGSKLLAERIRIAVANEWIPAVGHAVTASFGIATTQRAETAQEVLKRADMAMYQSKRLGKNQVVAAASAF